MATLLEVGLQWSVTGHAVGEGIVTGLSVATLLKMGLSMALIDHAVGGGIVTGLSVATLFEMGLSLVCQWSHCWRWDCQWLSVATLLEMGLSLVCQWPRCWRWDCHWSVSGHAVGDGIVTGLSVAALLEMGLSMVCQLPRRGPRFKPGTFGIRSGVLDTAFGVLLQTRHQTTPCRVSLTRVLDAVRPLGVPTVSLAHLQSINVYRLRYTSIPAVGPCSSCISRYSYVQYLFSS